MLKPHIPCSIPRLTLSLFRTLKAQCGEHVRLPEAIFRKTTAVHRRGSRIEHTQQFVLGSVLVVHVSKCKTKEAAKAAFAELEKIGLWRFMRRVSLYFFIFYFYFPFTWFFTCLLVAERSVFAVCGLGLRNEG